MVRVEILIGLFFFLLFKEILDVFSQIFMNLLYYLEVRARNLLYIAWKLVIDKLLTFLTLFCVFDKKFLFLAAFDFLNIIYQSKITKIC